MFVCLFVLGMIFCTINFCFGLFEICQLKTNCGGLRSLSEIPNLV